MEGEPMREDHPRMQAAIEEFKELIRGAYPEASFDVSYDVSYGEDPEGVYLIATVDIEDTDEVVDLYVDRLVDLQVDEGLPLYIITLQPFERVAAEMRAQRPRSPQPVTSPPAV